MWEPLWGMEGLSSEFHWNWKKRGGEYGTSRPNELKSPKPKRIHQNIQKYLKDGIAELSTAMLTPLTENFFNTWRMEASKHNASLQKSFLRRSGELTGIWNERWTRKRSTSYNKTDVKNKLWEESLVKGTLALQTSCSSPNEPTGISIKMNYLISVLTTEYLLAEEKKCYLFNMAK